MALLDVQLCIQMKIDHEWDPDRARINFQKHGVRFADAREVFRDDRALTIEDDFVSEQRFIKIGSDVTGRLPVDVRGQHMKEHYDFTGGKRGAIDPTSAGKTRITIRIDDDVLEWFREVVDEAGGGSYQALMNGALREYMMRQREPLELILRRVLREELAAYTAGSSGGQASDDSR